MVSSKLLTLYSEGNLHQLASALASATPEELAGADYEWKEEHAQEVSDFLQASLSELAPHLSLEQALGLADNYLLALSHLPDAPGLAARFLLAFWEQKPSPGQAQQLVDHLLLLADHPDAENPQAIRQAASTLQG